LGVVDGKREKALARLGRLGGRYGGQHHGVIDRADDGAVRLAGDFAGLERDLLRAEGEGFLDRVQRESSVVRRKQKTLIGPMSVRCYGIQERGTARNVGRWTL